MNHASRKPVYAALTLVAFSGVSTATVAMNLWRCSVTHAKASRAGVFSYLEPVFAAIVATVFLGESLTLPTTIGAILVFAGIFLSTRD